MPTYFVADADLATYTPPDMNTKPLTFYNNHPLLNGLGHKMVDFLVNNTKVNPGPTIPEKKQLQIATVFWRIRCGFGEYLCARAHVRLHVRAHARVYVRMRFCIRVHTDFTTYTISHRGRRPHFPMRANAG